jgi:phosphoribosylanthranilate isomerase
VLLPDFITFTGADDERYLEQMWAITKQFHQLYHRVEWALLYSDKHRFGGKPRYCTPEFIAKVVDLLPNVAIHLCGDIAHEFLEKSYKCLPFWQIQHNNRIRIQINGNFTNDVKLSKLCTPNPIIFQWSEDKFPNTGELDQNFLYDKSGGKGQSPDSWAVPSNQFATVGYAGGIGPHNVKDVIEGINKVVGQTPYWIDMESSLRTDDRFDISKCMDVATQVYGNV